MKNHKLRLIAKLLHGLTEAQETLQGAMQQLKYSDELSHHQSDPILGDLGEVSRKLTQALDNVNKLAG